MEEGSITNSPLEVTPLALVQQTRGQAFAARNRTLVEIVTNWKDGYYSSTSCVCYCIGHHGGKAGQLWILADSWQTPSPLFHKYTSLLTRLGTGLGDENSMMKKTDFVLMASN